MPYASQAQQKWAHTPSAQKVGFPTQEFDQATEGKVLPTKAPPQPASLKALHHVTAQGRHMGHVG